MNLAGVAFTVSLVLAALTAVAGAVLPAGRRPTAVGGGTAAAGVAGVVAGIAAMAGQGFWLSVAGLLPLAGARFEVDRLGGLFIAVVGGVAVAAAVYGIGYARHGLDTRPVQTVFPLFVAVLMLVPAAASVAAFLLCWQLVALASLLLVVAEHRRRPQVAEAGLWYAVMTQLGFLTVLIGLLAFASRAADDSFTALREATGGMSPVARGVIFVVTLLGFAVTAGIAPLHAWLPRAHPEAPSHVSALMSAAMVSLGVYGIIRIGFDLLGGGDRWWWLLVLALGAISAVYGILQATASTDLKRLMAYATTANVGLVLIGVGAAGLFASAGERVLAGLALTAALLHVINHAAFTTLLFLAAGSVLHATWTRNLDALGGLRASMPITTGFFAVGALAASALPPGNAFVSEWLLVQSLVHGLPAAGVITAIAMPVAIAAVALTAGLAVAAFVKAFGVGFLAKPRTMSAAQARESTPGMRAGMGVAAVACVVLALAPTAVLPGLAGVVGATGVTAGDPVTAGAITLRLNGFAGSLSPLLLTVAVVVAVAAIAGLLRVLAARRERRTAAQWDFGGGPMTARMEYTATSFAEPLQRVFDDALEPRQEGDGAQYRRRVPDRIERRLYQPVLAAVSAWGRAGRWLATVGTHRYLGYGFSALTAMLIVLAVTR